MTNVRSQYTEAAGWCVDRRKRTLVVLKLIHEIRRNQQDARGGQGACAGLSCRWPSKVDSAFLARWRTGVFWQDLPILRWQTRI